jgi:hypothetical protein
MKREIKKYLFDIKTSIDSINEFLGEKRDFLRISKKTNFYVEESKESLKLLARQ